MCFPKTSLSVPRSEECAACGWCFQELAGHWADLVHALPSGYSLVPAVGDAKQLGLAGDKAASPRGTWGTLSFPMLLPGVWGSR